MASRTKPTMYMFFQLTSGPRIMPVHMNAMAIETAIHADQMPIGALRLEAGNHAAIIDGAITVIRPMPKPSITRLTIKTVEFSAVKPIIEPMMANNKAARPVLRAPNLRAMPTAGNARTMPRTLNRDMTQPAPWALSPRDA